MAISNADRLKAQAVVAAFQIMLDVKPNVVETAEYISIVPTADQAAKIRAMLENWMSQKPGAVRVETSAILTPIFLKKMAPMLLAAMAGGFGLGKYI